MDGLWIALLVLVAGIGGGYYLLKPSRQVALQVGQQAPDFTLTDQSGQTRSLADFKGKWLALYFYPKDDTPGCTRQACAFRDDHAKLQALGAEVVGVSVDTVQSHADFADKFSLTFPLLADNATQTATRYRSLVNLGVIKFARRNTFLIDPGGKIAKVYLSASARRNAGEVAADLMQISNERADRTDSDVEKTV